MTPSDWLALWEEFGFNRERDTPYQYVSPTQLQAAMRLSDRHSGKSEATIEDAIGEELMEVRDTNDEFLGYQIHPGVRMRE